MARMIHLAVRTALIGLLVVAPARAQPNPTGRPTSESSEFAVLEKSAIFEVAPISGALKETRQHGQQLVWHLKERSSEEAFRIINLSVGLLRGQTGDQVVATFSGNISSLGYTTPDEVKLHIIFRTKGGAALYTFVVGVSIKCTDKDQSLHPRTDEIPRNIAGNVFANVISVEITQHPEQRLPGLKVLRCS